MELPNEQGEAGGEARGVAKGTWSQVPVVWKKPR
jgi:hypothetical protein